VAPVAPIAPVAPAAPCCPVAPVAPVAPDAPSAATVTCNIAGWLVVVLSFESNITDTLPVPCSRRPLFGVPLTQSWTACVASISRKVPAEEVEIGIAEAMSRPGNGLLIDATQAVQDW